MDCPCGSGATAEACCLPIIRGTNQAETAEALMRARYSAYVLSEIDFLLESVHPDHREGLERTGIEEWSKSSTWKGLEILDTHEGGPDDDTGTVTFVARYTADSTNHEHHERAQFDRVDGRWHFTKALEDAVETIRRTEPKVGRNDPCPCGSGKKYKKCHGVAA
jgi:SEC-C motif-containing protein